MLTLMEEHRLRVFENLGSGEYLGLRGTRLQRNGDNYIMRSLGIFTPYPILCGW